MAGRRARRARRAHSAGGVVYRRGLQGPEVLLLRHESGKWMLPKGTTEAGETDEQVALREVTEETGLRNVRCVADLGEERYQFYWRPERTFYDKTVHYYLLEWQGGEEPAPQREEGFVDAQWVPIEEAVRRVRYRETKEVLRRAQQALKAQVVAEGERA
jgi:8-oxo-dGTP pyrophosphatase MutT (NUDIX family)